MRIFQDFERLKRKYFRSRLLVLFCCLMILSSCAVKRVDIYPEFMDQKQRVNGVAMLCDYFVVDDIKGKVDLVDVPRNINAAKGAMDALDIQLKYKGYNTVCKEVVSMGLYAKDKEKSYKIAKDKSPTSNEEFEALPEILPPFFVNKTFCDTEEKSMIMSQVIEKLSTYTRNKGEPMGEIPEAKQIQTGYNEDVILFLLIKGTDVPVGKSIGQAVATAILTLGFLSMAQVSSTTVSLYMVETSTGKIIWSDSIYSKSKPSSPKTHQRVFTALVKRIPAR